MKQEDSFDFFSQMANDSQVSQSMVVDDQRRNSLISPEDTLEERREGAGEEQSHAEIQDERFELQEEATRSNQQDTNLFESNQNRNQINNEEGGFDTIEEM